MSEKSSSPGKGLPETLQEFAVPIIQELPADAELKQLKNALTIAITIWNAVVLDDLGAGHDFVKQARQPLEELPEPGRTNLLATFETLVERKRRLFRDDLRAVGKWDVSRGPGGDL